MFDGVVAKQIEKEILSASKIKKRTGKGYEYPAIGHVVGLEGKFRGDRRKLLAMAGY